MFLIFLEEVEVIVFGVDGLLFLFYFLGECIFLYDLYVKGIFFGLNLIYMCGYMYRVFLEGIMYGMVYVVEIYWEVGVELSCIFVVGGGIKNVVWF